MESFEEFFSFSYSIRCILWPFNCRREKTMFGSSGRAREELLNETCFRLVRIFTLRYIRSCVAQNLVFKAKTVPKTQKMTSQRGPKLKTCPTPTIKTELDFGRGVSLASAHLKIQLHNAIVPSTSLSSAAQSLRSTVRCALIDWFYQVRKIIRLS